MSKCQFVIMFNDYPEEVCAEGTTEEQANARAAQIKQKYMQDHQHDGIGLYVRAYSVPAPSALEDDDLPGMWSTSDFTGGDPDERSYGERNKSSAPEGSAE